MSRSALKEVEDNPKIINKLHYVSDKTIS